MLFSMLVLSMLVLLAIVSSLYLVWMGKRQRVEREAFALHKLMQEHYLQLMDILLELEPLMQNDKELYKELQDYVHAYYEQSPVLGDIDALKSKEFCSFLVHLQKDAKEHIGNLSSSITRRLDEMSLSLTRARESYSYAYNEYAFLSSTFPINFLVAMIEDKNILKR